MVPTMVKIKKRKSKFQKNKKNRFTKMFLPKIFGYFKFIIYLCIVKHLNLEIMRFNEVRGSFACIYRIKFPDGKYYVGQTLNFADRFKLYERIYRGKSSGVFSKKNRVSVAIERYGLDSLEIDILQKVSAGSKDDLQLCLSILEVKYIREQDCIYPNGYNTSIGDELLGIPADVIETNFGVSSSNFGCKPILVYGIDGKFVKEYPSIARCAYGLGVDEKDIKAVLDRRHKLLKSTYMLKEKKYGEAPKKILPFSPEVVVQRKTKTEYDVVKEKVYKKVELDSAAIMYDKQGNYVALFDNKSHSRKYLDIGFRVAFGREFRGYYLFHYNGGEIKKNIGEIKSKVVKTILYDDILAYGDAKNIGELISFADSEETVEEKPKREKKQKIEKPKKEKKPKVIKVPKKKPRINKYTLDGDYVATYETTTDAALADNVYPSAILACAKKKVRRCGDYIYRFEGDELDLPTFSNITLKQRLSKQNNLFE